MKQHSIICNIIGSKREKIGNMFNFVTTKLHKSKIELLLAPNAAVAVFIVFPTGLKCILSILINVKTVKKES